jgi:PAS domain S-box-containing protein
VEFFFNVRLTPTVFNDGKTGVTIIIEDVTSEKENEISLRKMVEEILSCIDDAVILVNSRTPSISFVNATAQKMFGYKSEELVGKDPKVLFVLGQPIPKYYGNLHEAFGTRGCYETESLLKRKGGKEFPVTLHLRPIYDDTGRLRNIVMVIRDTTSKKISNDTGIRSETGNPQIPLSMRICTDFERYRSVT